MAQSNTPPSQPPAPQEAPRDPLTERLLSLPPAQALTELRQQLLPMDLQQLTDVQSKLQAEVTRSEAATATAREMHAQLEHTRTLRQLAQFQGEVQAELGRKSPRGGWQAAGEALTAAGSSIAQGTRVAGGIIGTQVGEAFVGAEKLHHYFSEKAHNESKWWYAALYGVPVVLTAAVCKFFKWLNTESEGKKRGVVWRFLRNIFGVAAVGTGIVALTKWGASKVETPPQVAAQPQATPASAEDTAGRPAAGTAPAEGATTPPPPAQVAAPAGAPAAVTAPAPSPAAGAGGGTGGAAPKSSPSPLPSAESAPAAVEPRIANPFAEAEEPPQPTQTNTASSAGDAEAPAENLPPVQDIAAVRPNTGTDLIGMPLSVEGVRVLVQKVGNEHRVLLNNRHWYRISVEEVQEEGVWAALKRAASSVAVTRENLNVPGRGSVQTILAGELLQRIERCDRGIYLTGGAYNVSGTKLVALPALQQFAQTLQNADGQTTISASVPAFTVEEKDGAKQVKKNADGSEEQKVLNIFLRPVGPA